MQRILRGIVRTNVLAFGMLCCLHFREQVVGFGSAFARNPVDMAFSVRVPEIFDDVILHRVLHDGRIIKQKYGIFIKIRQKCIKSVKEGV